MLKKLRSEQGFTLLELLVVIVIIGILALLIIPNLTSAPKKARDVQRKTDLRAVQKSLEEYYVSNNAYPVTTTFTALSTSLVPSIMRALPVDPSTGNPVYYYSGTATAYTLKGCLENTGDAGQYVLSDTTYCGTGGKAFTLNNNN